MGCQGAAERAMLRWVRSAPPRLIPLASRRLWLRVNEFNAKMVLAKHGCH